MDERRRKIEAKFTAGELATIEQVIQLYRAARGEFSPLCADSRASCLVEIVRQWGEEEAERLADLNGTETAAG